MHERNSVETIVDNDGIFWLNKKEGLNHESLQVTTVTYLSGHKKHRYEQVDEQKNNQTELLYAKN